MTPTDNPADSANTYHDVVFTTELTDAEKASLAENVTLSPAGEVALGLTSPEVMADKVQQEVSQAMNAISTPEGQPITKPTPAPVEADYVSKESKEISEIESLQHFETPMVSESSPKDTGLGLHSPITHPLPISVPLKQYLETISRLEDPIIDSNNAMKLPKYPIFTATPLDDPGRILTESMKEDIYLNNPDMRAAAFFDTDTVERLVDPLPLERLPASTNLLIKYPLEWLELNPTKIQACKLPALGMCKVYYSHPRAGTVQSSYILKSTAEDGRISLVDISADNPNPDAGYQDESLVTPPVSTVAKTDASTPKNTNDILDNPMCDAVDQALKDQNKVDEVTAEAAVPASSTKDQYPRVLFLHGFEFDTTINAPFINALSKTHEILTFDWPATGGSDRTPEDSYDMDTLIRYCLEVLSLPVLNWISGFEIFDEPPGVPVQPLTEPSSQNEQNENNQGKSKNAATVRYPVRTYRLINPGSNRRKLTLIGHSSGGLIAAVMAPVLKDIIEKVVLLAPVGMTMELNKKMEFMRNHPLLARITQPLMSVYPTLALKTFLDCADRVKYLPEPLQANVKRKYESHVRSRCTNAIKQAINSSVDFPWTSGKDHFVKLNDLGLETILILANDDTIIQCAKAQEQFKKYCPNIKILFRSFGGHDFHLVYPLETLKLCDMTST